MKGLRLAALGATVEEVAGKKVEWLEGLDTSIAIGVE